MILIPYERLIIRTSLNTQEALQELKGVVEPKRLFRLWNWGTNTKLYEGKIEESRFAVNRIINYRNSFLPMITGEITPEISGCSVHITMQPHLFVIVFMSLWLTVVGAMFFIFLAAFIKTATQTNAAQSMPAIALLVPAIMLIFGYGLLWGSFKIESVKSKTFFRNLFQANEMFEFGMSDLFKRD